MNKPFLGAILIALALIIAIPAMVGSPFQLLELPHRLSFERDSFIILFAALFGISKGLRAIPLIAILLGSFLDGPLVTSLVASLIVYDRATHITSWWFRLKDIFFLSFLVVACGLPEPLRSIVTFCGVVGVSLDFGFGMLSLLPAVLLSHTARGAVLADELLCILTAGIFFLHLVWIWVNGAEKAGSLWKNALTMLILFSSFLIKGHAFLPIMVVTVLACDLILNLRMGNAKSDRNKAFWIIGSLALAVCGFPFFVAQTFEVTLMQRELMWAIAIIPAMLFYFSLSYVAHEKRQSQELYPLWSLGIFLLLSTNAVWWSTLFGPSVEMGKWGAAQSLMSLLFEHSPTNGEIDATNFLISQGLVLVGLGFGFVLYRFFKPEDKVGRLESYFVTKANQFRKSLLNMGSAIHEARTWMTENYNTPKASVADYVDRLVIGFVIVAILIVGVHFIKMGVWYEP